jgi:AraC-like DNA-binding protein
MGEILKYESEGELEDSDVQYSNVVRFYEDGGEVKGSLKTVLRDPGRPKDREEIYKRTVDLEVAQETYERWIQDLTPDEVEIEDLNEDSRLEMEGDEHTNPSQIPEIIEKVEDSISKRRSRYVNATSDRGKKRALWLNGDYIGGQDVDKTWEGVELSGKVAEVLGESSIRRMAVRSTEDWEQKMPEDYIQGLPEEEFALYRLLDMERTASEIKESEEETMQRIKEETGSNPEPFDVFKALYSGNLDHKHDYYIFRGQTEKSGNLREETLVDPLTEEIEDAIDSFGESLTYVKHLHHGRADTYFEDEAEKLTERETTVRAIEDGAPREDSIFGKLHTTGRIRDRRIEGLTNLQNAVVAKEDVQKLENIMEAVSK